MVGTAQLHESNHELTFKIVIKLKQVEHVRNERNTLAAVAGHPFITTLITSFSDHDCLYMVVRIHFGLPNRSQAYVLLVTVGVLPRRRGVQFPTTTATVR